MGQPSGSNSGSSGSNQSFSSQRFVKKETAVTQLSPVKKRIKENKDHYIGNIFIHILNLPFKYSAGPPLIF